MHYYMYEIEKKKNRTKIKGYVDTFDSKKHLIFDYKFIFILPNGKCLFIPYAERDDRTRSLREYEHKVYLFSALEMLYNELKDTKGNYMNEEHFAIFIEKKFGYAIIPEFIKAILISDVAMLYDAGNYDNHGEEIDDIGYITYFHKNKNLSLKQKNTLLEIKESLKKEEYGIKLATLIDDESLNFNLSFGYTFEEDGPVKWVIKKQEQEEIDTFFVDEAYKILGLPERKQGDGEFLR